MSKTIKDPKEPNRPSGLAAQAAGKMAASQEFSFSRYMADMKDQHEAALVPPGRYGIRISDVRVGAEPTDRGLYFGVLEAELIDHPDAEPLVMFAAVNVSNELKGENGDLRIEDPVTKKQFLAGLKTVENLINMSGVDMSEIHGATDAEEMLQTFVGCEFLAVIGKGKDQHGLSCNVVKKLVKGLGND